MNIIKRDGRAVEFDKNRITTAIRKAVLAESYDNKSVYYTTAEDIADKVASQCHEGITVEEIQDIVENELIAAGELDVAKQYIKYREKRSIARGKKTYETFMTIINTENNDITKENANMNAETPAGMMMKFASETTRGFTMDYLLSDRSKEYVKNNIIHIHDMDYYPTKSLTCVQHPLDKLLSQGFRAGHGACRPSKHFESASFIGCNTMEAVQNEMHGGQAIPYFDFYLAPYVRITFKEELDKISEVEGIDLSHLYDAPIKDYIYKPLTGLTGDERYIQHAINLTVKRVHKSCVAFIHNMNSIHSRGGNQVVFSSINYGCDTSAEGRCVIREVLNATYEGVGNGETAIFPIQIWQKKRGVNYLPEDPNYDLYCLACKVTCKRFFPNFLNCDASYNIDDKFDLNDPKRYMHIPATMGCRTRVFENRFGDKCAVGRGNLSFTTINLVRLALMSNKDIDKFFELFDDAIDAAAEQLYERYRFQCTAKKSQFPMLMSGVWMDSEKLKPDDIVEPVLKHGTLSMGFIGLAECLIALTGHHHGESEESQKLGLKIITHLSDKCAYYANKKNLNYGVLATPAEGLSGKFVKKDRKDFGIIKNVTDRDYYTNSNHVPVWYKCTVEHKAEVEAPYHNLTRSGHIFYVELDGDATKNPHCAMQVVDLMDKYDIGYGSINHTRNRCMDCGYENAEKDLVACPKCGSTNIDTIQRITGYLVGTLSSWNNGKKAELHDRIKHGFATEPALDD